MAENTPTDETAANQTSSPQEDPGSSQTADKETASGEGVSTSLVDSLLFGLSIPERSARSISAVVAGFANETASRLIPSAFRTSKSYTIFIQQSLDFMIHDVGGVEQDVNEGDSQSEDALANASIARRAVGGMLDFAGMATIHLSPMTILAIVSDVAYGSSTYIRRLSEELKKEGIIDQESTVDHVSDLLDALQATADKSSDAFNAPPLNIDGLKDTINQTRESLGKIDPTSTIPEHEIKRIWDEMEAAAAKEDTSILNVATTMTMFSMNRLSLVTRGALSTVSVAGDLIDQHILGHYSDALLEIQSHGLWTTLSKSSEPYLDAIWDNFDSETSTITEDLLTGKLIGEAWTGFTSWWSTPNTKKDEA